MARIKILCVCGVGLGTSLMAKMTVDKLLAEIKLDASVEALDAGSAKGQKADLIVTTTGIAKALGDLRGAELVTVDNFADRAALRAKLLPVLEGLKKPE